MKSSARPRNFLQESEVSVNYNKKIKNLIMGLGVTGSLYSFADGPNRTFFQPHGNWLPVISICTVSKLYGKEKYDGRIKFFNSYKDGDKPEVLCKNNNIRSWDFIRIKRRGNSSNKFAKKQYQLAYEDEKNRKKRDISLGGFSKNDKWIINGPYVDRSHIRNIFTFALGNQMAATRNSPYFAPRTKAHEVYLNNVYHGVYILIEKIGRGKDKVDIPKFSPKNESPIKFIAEISSNDGSHQSRRGTFIEYKYPSDKKIANIAKKDPKKAKRIEHDIDTCIQDFENILADPDKLNNVIQDPKQKYFDVDSFIDYILIQEITKNIDGLRRSAFFHRKADGKIYMGPLWDFNLALGNLSFYGMSLPHGWLMDKRHLNMKNAFWFYALINNDIFRERLIKRYFSLRKNSGILSTKKSIILSMNYQSRCKRQVSAIYILGKAPLVLLKERL